jgi:hypothetical protein
MFPFQVAVGVECGLFSANKEGRQIEHRSKEEELD